MAPPAPREWQPKYRALAADLFSLSAIYSTFGHTTLTSYLPIILANALMPLGIYLTLREITKRNTFSFLAALTISTFPFLRFYTMDVAEADALLMTSVVFAGCLRLRADRPSSGLRMHVLSGAAAGLASFARPEGVLYVAGMYLASLPSRWRSRGYWISVLTLALGVGAFSAVSLREFGMLWPGNHSSTLSVANFGETLDVVLTSGVFSLYAAALAVPNALLAALVAISTLATVVTGWWMARQDPRLIYMPVMALANIVMVFLVGPIPAEAAKYHDFFRHISYGFPLLGITLAYGLNEVVKRAPRRLGAIPPAIANTAIASLLLLHFWLLQGPVRSELRIQGPLMPTDVHVTAARLLVNPFTLPTMEFRQAGPGYVPASDNYMAIYPDDVYAYYAESDVRRADNSSDYYAAALTLTLGFLLLALAPSLRHRQTRHVPNVGDAGSPL